MLFLRLVTAVAWVSLVQGSTELPCMRLRGGDLATTAFAHHSSSAFKEMPSTTAPEVGPYELDVYGTPKGIEYTCIT